MDVSWNFLVSIAFHSFCSFRFLGGKASRVGQFERFSTIYFMYTILSDQVPSLALLCISYSLGSKRFMRGLAIFCFTLSVSKHNDGMMSGRLGWFDRHSAKIFSIKAMMKSHQ